jgi:signal transduction histidine kinase
VTAAVETDPVRGRIDAAGRLASADPELAALHARAGGEDGGALAVPQIATVARLARRLGILVSRPVIAADGDMDLDLWVRAQPEGNEVDLAITGWRLREPHRPAIEAAEREMDFERAGAEWSWQSDEALRFTAISPAVAAALGKSVDYVTGKPITRIFRLQEDADGALPMLAALAAQRRFDDQRAEFRVRGKPLYRLSGVPLLDSSGRFAGFRGSATRIVPGDPLERRSAERPPSSNAAFTERLDRALREPLDNIIANADSIAAQPEGPLRRDYAGYARDIAVAGRHLLDLVGDLVDLQAIERPDFAPEAEEVDLADIAGRVAGLLSVRAADSKVRIEAPAAGAALPASGEFKRVLQIAVNLVANAVRYAPAGTSVEIALEQDGDEARLIVVDRGKGIAAEDQQRVFEKFERLDPSEPGGTGLGLYIARRLARAMGGDLRLESAAGEGARFTLVLPTWK